MPERNPFFPEISGRLGLGCRRMPRAGDGVDMPLTEKLVDLLMARGYNYFDTAHGYVDGKSETALRRLLVERYPRESFVLADKLSTAFFERQEDIRPLFESQLAACGVDYFDFYLMHAQREDLYEKFMACRAYETAAALKAEGKIRHFGVSFHGTAAFLERLLDEQPGIEAVQIQFNYLDYPDPVIQSGACYEVCRARGVPVFVMEPVKGGSLARLPQAAARELGPLGDVSQAGLALRYAAGFDGVAMVLSGMNSVEQLEENAALMDRLPVLCGRVPGPDRHPGRAGLRQQPAALRRGQVRVLLSERLYIQARPGLGLRPVRPVRARLSPAPAHPGAAGGRGGDVRHMTAWRNCRAGRRQEAEHERH